MKKPFFISLGVHIGIFILMFITRAFSTPMKPPEKMYSVRILAAPIPTSRRIIEEVIEKKKEKPKQVVKPSEKTKPVKKKPSKEEDKRPRKTTAHGTASVQVEGKDFADDFYLNLVINKVANNWLNPLRGGRKFSTKIYFRIQRSGEITDTKIETQSGHSLFDQSALRAVLSSSLLPPLPESYSSDFLGVHFEFEHRGR